MSLLSSVQNSLPGPAISASKSQTSPAEARLRFPTGEILNYGVMLKFLNYKYEQQGAKASFTQNISNAHIFLPLPGSIAKTLGIQYDSQDLGVAGQLYNQGYQSGAGIAQAYKNAGLAGMSDTGSDKSAVDAAAATGVDTAAYIARRIISGVSAETGASIDLSSGTVANPYQVATFKSVGARQHSMTFRLVAQSPADSKMIKRICDELEYHSLPSRNGLFLSMPEEVEIAYYGTNFLFKFARCVISSVGINYNPFGTPAFFPDGSPVAVELTVNFQEIEQITKESFGDFSSELDTSDSPVTDTASGSTNDATRNLFAAASGSTNPFAGVTGSATTTANVIGTRSLIGEVLSK